MVLSLTTAWPLETIQSRYRSRVLFNTTVSFAVVLALLANVFRSISNVPVVAAIVWYAMYGAVSSSFVSSHVLMDVQEHHLPPSVDASMIQGVFRSLVKALNVLLTWALFAVLAANGFDDIKDSAEDDALGVEQSAAANALTNSLVFGVGSLSMLALLLFNGAIATEKFKRHCRRSHNKQTDIQMKTKTLSSESESASAVSAS